MYFKDDHRFSSVALAPARPIVEVPPDTSELGLIARTYNAIGGLADALAQATGAELMSVLAVWHVESGPYAFVPGRPVLRFENHKFWRYWGSAHSPLFDRHFQFGGHPNPGKVWQGHMFRNPTSSSWRSFHGDQGSEYEVLHWAAHLSDLDTACMSASFGGPQIMGFNHDALGYADARSLFHAFGEDLRWQVLGFFDFCRQKSLMHAIIDKVWVDFGEQYNGDGAAYGPKLKAAYDLKRQLEHLPR